MRVRRLVAVAAVMVAVSVAVAPAASAVDILGCTDAPTPEVPGRGITGFFAPPPKVLPPAGDPFAANPTTTVYEQYGYAGLIWNTYDLGCGPDLARSPDATIGTAVANWIVSIPKAAVAATGALVGAAFEPTFLGMLDPLVTQVVDVLRRTVFEQWLFLVLAALGVFIIWRARQQALSSTAAAVGWALLVMVLATAVFRWPLMAGHAADQSVTAVLGGVNAGLNGQDPTAGAGAGTEATAQMHGALLYQAWLAGTFGSTTSDVAKEYGPVIFDSTALTWAQADTLRKDPEAGKKIIEEKQHAFEDAAAKIKDADPDAYAYLQGKHSDNRVGYAMLAGLATLCAVPFLFVAGLLVVGALVIVRFGVMVFPAFAVLGLFPTMRHLVTDIGSTIVAALINCCAFGIGASVTVLGLGALMKPEADVPPWLQIILMLVLTVVMFLLLRPFRRLTQMVSRRNHFQEAVSAPATAGRGAWRLGKRVAAAAVTGGVAGAVAGQVIDDASPAAPPQRAETQPDQTVIVHPPAPAIEADRPPTVIVASTRDLPSPAAAASSPVRAPVEITASSAGTQMPPARIEASDTTYPDVDWTPYEQQMAEES